MKSVIDRRITIQTFNEVSIHTKHVLVYAAGNKFKVLNNEEGYSAAILGCMMEAFEEVMSTNQMDKEIRDFLMNLKGNLGDKLKTNEFRASVRSFLTQSSYMRRTGTALVQGDEVSSVYFNWKHDRTYYAMDNNDSKSAELMHKMRFSAVSLASNYGLLFFMKYYRPILLESVFIPFIPLTFLTLVYAWKTQSLITSTNHKIDTLAKIIMTCRDLYKSEIKVREDWVKYPMIIPMHSCNLMPFNKTLIKIVNSETDIEEYIHSAINNSEKSTIAIWDSNWESSLCYIGFELGNGNIRPVILDSEFMTKQEYNANELLWMLQLPEGINFTIDNQIRHYQ